MRADRPHIHASREGDGTSQLHASCDHGHTGSRCSKHRVRLHHATQRERLWIGDLGNEHSQRRSRSRRGVELQRWRDSRNVCVSDSTPSAPSSSGFRASRHHERGVYRQQVGVHVERNSCRKLRSRSQECLSLGAPARKAGPHEWLVHLPSLPKRGTCPRIRTNRQSCKRYRRIRQRARDIGRVVRMRFDGPSRDNGPRRILESTEQGPRRIAWHLRRHIE